jgi:hypothetical protein
VRRLAAAAAILVAAVCSGCGSSAKNLRPNQLQRAVLQPADLRGWTRFQNDPGTIADTGPLGSPDRTGDWIARYRRADGLITSRVDLYRSAKAAHAAYAKLQEAVSSTTGPHLPSVGSERFGYRSGTLVGVYWRRANVVASLVADGARIDPGALAADADARIARASG